MTDLNFVQRTAQISWEIREALRNALPAPTEQFFTVLSPAVPINLNDFNDGGLNQAILCSEMPALAPVQFGSTGKSVASCYEAAINRLIPACATTPSADVVVPDNVDEEEERYWKALGWLTELDGSKTRVDTYTEAHEAHMNAVKAKKKDFDDALKRAQDDPSLTSEQEKRAAYDAWVAQNAKRYRNAAQAAYMGWVIAGKKEEVEYWFAIVDRDSAMAQIGASKKAMRAAVVQGGSDSSVEYHKVESSPSNWAVIAQCDRETAELHESSYFTSITVAIASAQGGKSIYTHSSLNWDEGAFHSEAAARATKEMSNNEIKISFECMRVDVARPWLFAELFYDTDLNVRPNMSISPGFIRLRQLMEQSPELGMTPEEIKTELNRYDTFPMYPTAFLLAVNVILEITGETTRIQAYFRESSASTSDDGFNIGPFAVSTSHAGGSQASHAICDPTVGGCRITLKTPQIIGWISQIIPALPRLRG